jgi:hypothetical protein
MTPCQPVGVDINALDFSLEDGDSMLLRNVGIYLRVYTESNARKKIVIIVLTDR